MDSCFGRFALVTDENAGEDSLETMKIEFEAASCLNSCLENMTGKDVNVDLKPVIEKKQMPIRKTIDYQRLSKLCHI